MKCTQCNNPTVIPGSSFCSHCGARITSAHEQGNPLDPVTFVWESVLTSSAPLHLLADTVTGALLHPNLFYQQVVLHASRTFPAWIYGLIIGSIGLTASWAWSQLKAPAGSIFYFNWFIPGGGMSSASTLAAAPFILSLQMVLTAVYVFITLRLSSLRRPAFGKLFRTLCYAESPMLLQLIPFVGTYAATFFWLYAMLTALHHLYEGSRLKILFHLLLPLFLLFAFAMVIIIAGILGGIIAGSGLAQNWKFLLDIVK